jgi:hypothetical protein
VHEPTEAELELWRNVAEPGKGARFFIEQVLGETLDEQQKPIVDEFDQHRSIVVTSGHSSGKDFLAARLALRYHVTFYPSIVITTGPSQRQVEQIVWGEIRAAYKKAKYPIGGELLPEAPKLKSGHPHHYMIGYTAVDADAFQGVHAPNILIIVTEAQGVQQRLWQAINSLMTAEGNAKLFVFGNPICEPDNEFAAMLTRKADRFKCFRLDSRKSSHCSKVWIDEMRAEYGEESPVWLARVEGILPDTIADTLIPIAWIERAYDLWRSGERGTGPDTMGLDIARFGSDETVDVRGDGLRFRVERVVQGQDLMQTAGHAKAAINAGIEPKNVRVDDTGLGGGVTDRLREQGHMVSAINFGASATDEEKHLNARTELFWSLRERFREGTIAIDPADRKLLRDLSVLRYKMTSKGQHKLEEKAEAKRRLGYSPDRADALALAALPADIAERLARGSKPGWGFLELARRASKAKAIPESTLKAAVGARAATEIPGAAEVLEGEHGRRQAGAGAGAINKAIAEEWRSVWNQRP